ncbi:bifunctional diaminohydroxyphosphoribosylaminopyrimidine deaminase/5-amino-6-(5-phosphoribosylamino)uracil reductase RibD [Edaphobacter modestus]|uniref:Riboflavin biosynthesis protein RibD n=1 Tax=Edaphobacter modestus TaxID=388466 RepID=A0A4Q7YYB8_9BACT|nr:bifunctional diaminohydroxyphosphoribosylaminopyrimidine deaminase/5-amino-6-(5-phosphoribosylamino)uracil reductase RibD [Edaphobacter modestus]RZU42748.1 diaminohydroxyphosphoribosylaminopyrimidine deaminase [Edaphobacter modestus]
MASTEQLQRDREHMRRALELASETTSLTSPNPQVGCVIVQDDVVLGEGAHLYDRYDHAEIVALKQAAARGHSVKGATAYVTLEPCSHHGRTGPCADALVAAGIARAVVATTDPNPLVSGRGLEKLRAAGIEVTVGVLQQEARELNEGFAHFIRARTPFVTLKAGLSADGKLAPQASHRIPNQPYWLTGFAARNQVQVLRHQSDAVLTGIGTVLADDPQLTDRSGLSRRRPLLRIVLDTHLRISRSSQLVRTADHDLLLLTGVSAPDSRISELVRAGAQVETVPHHAGLLSLPAVLSALAERNILSVLLEGGSHINGAFLQQKLVDKVVLFSSSITLGDQAVPFATGIISPSELEPSLHRITRTAFGADTSVTGYLRDPWPTE